MDNITALTYINRMGTPIGGPPFPSTMLLSLANVDLVPGKKHLDQSRASSRCDECGSGLRESDVYSQGQVRLDAELSSLCQVEFSNGSPPDRSVCVPSDTSMSSFLQLEARSRGYSNQCFHPRLFTITGLCQPTIVPYTKMPVTHQTAEGEDPTDHPSMEDTTMVPSPSGNAGGIPQDFTQETRPNVESNRSGIHHDSGPRSSRTAYLRDSFQSRRFSEAASKLLLTSWRAKTTSNYNSLFNKWVSWCEQRDRNPIDGPIEDIVNFLAELHEKGFQYRYLNSYRSAISSVHKHLEGAPIGQHPLVSRVLKGTFNERPLQPKYTYFWDVD